MEHKVSVFAYDNYRRFLEDSYKARKSADSKYSFRFFAKAAGFASSNYLKLIMQGKRNLAVESVDRVAHAFGLNKEEAEFFRSLVLFNQSTTVEQRQRHAQAMLGTRKLRKLFPLKIGQYEYYSHWYNIVVRELVGLKEFVEDPTWIAKKIVPQITPAQAQKALDLLQELGLVVRDSQGRLMQSETHITTPDEVTASSVAIFHREMMQRASEAIDNFSRDKREFSSVTLPLTAETAKKIKELIQNFRRGIVELASQEHNADLVYYVNLQLFPLTAADEAIKK